MTNKLRTAQDFVDFWLGLLQRSQTDPAFKQRLIEAPLDALKAEGFAVDTPQAGKAIEQSVRSAVDNPSMIGVLTSLASGRTEVAVSSAAPDYIKAEAKWFGLVLTLSPQACNDLSSGMSIAAALSSALGVIPAVGPALALVISVGLAASTAFIIHQNTGKGVYVTYLWVPPWPSWVAPVE